MNMKILLWIALVGGVVALTIAQLVAFFAK